MDGRRPWPGGLCFAAEPSRREPAPAGGGWREGVGWEAVGGAQERGTGCAERLSESVVLFEPFAKTPAGVAEGATTGSHGFGHLLPAGPAHLAEVVLEHEGGAQHDRE